LAETADRDGRQGDPLVDPLARDHAARDFRRYLQVEKRAAASTVNLALASLDALYRCLGLGRPSVRRDKPAQTAPCALDEAGQRLLLRAAEAAPIRARALVMLMLFTALRISETVALALDLDDVRITTRKGVLVVMGNARCGAKSRSMRWCAKSSTHGSSIVPRSPALASGRCGSAGPAIGCRHAPPTTDHSTPARGQSPAARPSPSPSRTGGSLHAQTRESNIAWRHLTGAASRVLRTSCLRSRRPSTWRSSLPDREARMEPYRAVSPLRLR
jgi:integrase